MSGAAAASLLAAQPSGVGPGLGAFLVVSAIAVATYFLIRSMNKQFKKINFEEKPPDTPRKDAAKRSDADSRKRPDDTQPPSGPSS